MPTPSTLNHYRILGPLGKGGMGEVFAADDTRLNRRVAIKILSELTAADPDRRQRFEREAQAIAALNHPNIVTIYSVEEAGGLPFIVMELVEGQTLSELIKDGGLPLDRLLAIGAAVSDAIAAAHQRGITHRDLKPANVMVTPEGRVKVLDFGLAKLRQEEAAAIDDGETRLPTGDLTGEGKILGTVAYMSPEQAEGRPIDPRSDIFSLGVMLHEMAVGERPFKGDTNVSIISSILKDTPDSVTDINPALPTGLSRIIRHALSKDPSRRYQTAIDLRNELEELKHDLDTGVTMSATAAAAAARRRGGSSRRVPPALMAAILAGLLVLGAAAYLLMTRGGGARTGGPFEIARVTRLTTSGNARQAVMSADGRYVVHLKTERGRSSLWVRQTATTSDVQIVPPVTGRYAGLAFSPDGNYVYYAVYGDTTTGVAMLYKVPVLGGAPQYVMDDVDTAVSFSPDGKQMAFMRGAPSEGRTYLMIAGADGSGARRVMTLDPPEFLMRLTPSWSPDGRMILVISQSLAGGPHLQVYAVDAATGKATPTGGQWAQVADVDWMPDGRSFVVTGSEIAAGALTTQLWQVPYPGTAHHRITVDVNNYLGASISADGKTIATTVVETESALWVVPASGGSGVRVTEGRGNGVGQAGVTWTPDGRIVYTSMASGSPQIWIAARDGTGARQITTGGYANTQPDVTPDGRYLLYSQVSVSGLGIGRIGLDGTGAMTLVQRLAFVPRTGGDGKYVYYQSPSSGSPRPFRVSIDGGTPEALGDEYFSTLDVSRDGTRVLGIGWDAPGSRNQFVVMNVADRSTQVLDVPVLGAATFSPDGESLAYTAPDNERPTIWRKPLAGGAPQRVTSADDNIFGFAWSPDGKDLLLVRGTTSSDVVIVGGK